MFEKSYERILSGRLFARRMALFACIAFLLITAAMAIGVAGYHWIAGFTLIDSILNASMILTGMGPVNPLQTNGAKLFASAYAIFSAFVFVALMGVIMAPIVHRILHSFHLERSSAGAKTQRNLDER